MNPSLIWIFLVVSALWLLGALVTAWSKATSVSLTLALLASLVAAGLGAVTWLGAWQWESVQVRWNLWQGLDVSTLPPLYITFGLDSLSAFFLFLVATFSALVAIYSFRALRAEHYRPYAHWIAAAFNLFSWTTMLVLAAQDGFSLLISLELMTLSFGYLVLYKHFLYQDQPGHNVDDNARRKARLAPQVYLIISHSSTVFMILAVLLLSINAGGLDYQAWINNTNDTNNNNTNNNNNLDTALMTAVFLLSLIGLGIRAGLTPAHIWVPLVHPSSPTTTHALSLGIAIKVAIYLMYRFFFQFLAPQSWWGYLLLTVAVMTAIVNVWYAISSHNLKEALAYHSIENIGIICAGIGLALIFWDDNRALALLGLVASLYHLLNHAVFKGLLYLATGAIDNLTHQNVDIERLGGLIHRYRFTASMFLIGSFAIAGFPPFNGFISEWLTLQAGLYGLSALVNAESDVISIALALVVIVSLLLLVASFALTAFCFYKMAGVGFLGLPRRPEEERVHWEKQDVPASMKLVMGLMAGLSLILGIVPGLITPQLLKAFSPLGTSTRPLLSANWQGLVIESGPASTHGTVQLPIIPLVILALLLTAGLLVLQKVFPLQAPRRRPTSPWSCGEPLVQHPVNQYTSGALSYSLRKLFAFFNPSSSVPEYLPSRFVLSSSPTYPQQVIEVFRLAYNRLIHALLKFSVSFGEYAQPGDISRYLQYVFWSNLVIIALYWAMSW